jgi:hypothetical protein
LPGRWSPADAGLSRHTTTRSTPEGARRASSTTVHRGALYPHERDYAVSGTWASHLECNPDEHIVDLWVVEHATLCALEGERVLAAAHLRRSGDGPAVSESDRGIGAISWLVAPGRGRK